MGQPAHEVQLFYIALSSSEGSGESAHAQTRLSLRQSHTVGRVVDIVSSKDVDPLLRQHQHHRCTLIRAIAKDSDPCLRQHGCTLAEHSLLPYKLLLM